MIRRFGSVSYRVARRIAISVIGGTVLVGGVIMLVIPGPGIAAIILGLAILAVEFAWARLWLRRLKDTVSPENRVVLWQRIRTLRVRIWNGGRREGGGDGTQ